MDAADETGKLIAGDQETQSDQESVDVPAAAGHRPKWRNWLQRIGVLRPLWGLYRGFKQRNGLLLSAGIAYYLLFSLAPVIFLTLRIVGHFLDPATAQEQLQQGLGTYVGPKLADLLTSIIIQSGASDIGIVTAIIGAAVLLYGATRLVMRLQASFNIMWDTRVRPTQFSYRKLLSRLLSLTLLLIPSAVLLISIAVQSVMPLQGRIGQGVVIGVSEWVAAFLVTWGVLIFVFAYLPDIRISVRDCWQGALLTATLCTIGTRVFGALTFWADKPKYSGLAGIVLTLIVWADFMAIIILLGVRLNKVLYQLSGKTVRPYEYAVVVEDPLALGADELNPEEWERLFSGASGVMKKTLSPTKKKTGSDARYEPGRDGSDDSGRDQP